MPGDIIYNSALHFRDMPHFGHLHCQADDHYNDDITIRYKGLKCHTRRERRRFITVSPSKYAF